MQSVTATYRDGQIILDSPVDWPDGSRISVVCIGEHLGLDESQWPTTEDGLRDLLAQMEAMEPIEFTSEDDAAIEAARIAALEYAHENWEQRATKLEHLF